MTDNPKKSGCTGCRNDYYNYGGHSTIGECWSLRDAKKVVRWKVPTHVAPPTGHKVKVYQCFHQQGYAFMDEVPIGNREQEK